MPFGRSAKPSNRSQHSLAVESAGSAAGGLDVAATGSAHAGLSVPVATGAQPQPQIQVGPGPSHPQLQLQLQQGSGPGPSPSASASASALGQGPSNLSLSSNEQPSFIQQQPPPSHLYAPVSASSDSQSAQLQQLQHQHQHQHQHQLQQLQPINTNPGGVAVTDAKARKAAFDFVDAVARSQSQRYHQVATPIQANPSYGASYEDLPQTLYQSVNQQQQQQQQQHPAFAYAQQQAQQQQQPPPPQQGTPVEPRRSTRRLIKNILAGAPKNEQHRSAHSHHHYSQSRSQAQLQSQSYNFYDTAHTGRRSSSKRVSNPNPPALRTGPSQVSLDQQSLDWQSQGTQTQPSPLQNNPHEFQQQQPTLRRVLTSSDQSPYSDADELAFHPPGPQIHVQTQQPVTENQPQLHQVVLDPTTQHYQFVTHSPHQSSPQGQVQPDGSSSVYASSGHLVLEPLHPNSETISQFSHESPVTEGEQHNHSNNNLSTAASPAARFSSQAQDFPSRTSSLQPPQQQENSSLGEARPSSQQQQQQQQSQQGIGPFSGGTPHPRPAQDSEENMPSGPPPGYRHSQQSSNSMNNALPSIPQSGGGQNSFRTSTIQERQPGQFEDQGRNSPQPTEDPEKAFKDLLTKYKNVKRLYFDGKSQIEALNGQVEQLQNAVANQRISQSRTALDDNEYMTRFNRLNGAINNLSFNIRKDWKSLPSWLEKYVSTEALKTGKQEMTAVGRAVITRWIVEEIFHSCFHPGLDPALSRQLKEVEQNIRRFSYTLNSQEEYDALTSKVVSWRMTTLEGLQNVLQSPESANHRQEFTRRMTSNLTASLFQHLAEPPPAGVDGSASTIVELAVGVAANLPLESRDVAIIYPLPQENIQPDLMDVEKTPLPPIETRPPDSDGDADSRGEDSGKDTGTDKSTSKERTKSRAGMSATSTISSILSNAPAALVPGAGNSRKGSVASTTGRKSSFAATDSTTNLALPPKDSNKVRFAGFLAVEVRGRQVLVKAPVWTLG